MEYINFIYELHSSSTPNFPKSGTNQKYHKGGRSAFYDAAGSFYTVKKSAGSI
jgi:hypothetical protein